MKPIEPGCLCVVHGGDAKDGGPPAGNTGTVVRVGHFLGEAMGLPYDDLWSVDKKLAFGFRRYQLAPERYLTRIDGHEETEEIEEAATA